VKSKLLFLCAMVVFTAGVMLAQTTGDVIGAHDLSPSGGSPIKGGVGGSCIYCHAPHSGVADLTPLWNQTLSTQTYTPYGSSTYVETGSTQPPLGTDSVLCLSCHDGTVAPGTTIVYHTIPMSGKMNNPDVFGTNLQSSHPFSLVLPIKDSPDLVASLVAQGLTGDPLQKIKLIKGNIECTTCHDPHIQAIDKVNMNFLVRDSSSGQMCLACHDPNRIVPGKVNRIAGWTTSIHALANNKTSSQPYVGAYGTVAQNACDSCHSPHDSPGPARLLRGPNEADCVACHSGGTNLSPPAPNIFAEFAKTGHPFTSGTSPHDAAESALLNQNRHSTCVDCHDGHAPKVTTFSPPPLIRGAQNGVVGISASDGITIVQPAVNQYENCLRCHGTSIGKVSNPIFGYLPIWAVAAGDPLNVIPQFSPSSTSSHPVFHDRSSPFSQPSLRANMVNLDGLSQGRAMGSRIFCSDCHNSDDNREFGGVGPAGPHGSRWTHIIERRYEFSQASAPGQLINNLFPNPDLSVNGPYGLCEKCHDLTQIMTNSSFTQHSRHINDGFTCSTCHTAHGMGGTSGYISGERMVNFDINVVAPNGTTPISYSHATNSCSLTCHQHQHQTLGSPAGKLHR
jgi:predicted CXXCH cytochrome family protein